MISRAEVVDSLMGEGMSEALAWHIVVRIRPEYLETLDSASLEDYGREFISDYLEYLRDSVLHV